MLFACIYIKFTGCQIAFGIVLANLNVSFGLLLVDLTVKTTDLCMLHEGTAQTKSSAPDPLDTERFASASDYSNVIVHEANSCVFKIFSAVSEPCQWLANQHHSMVAGKVLHDSDLVRRVDEAEARIAELSIQQNRGSQTTQTAQKLGSVGLLAISHKACTQNGMLAYVLSQ